MWVCTAVAGWFNGTCNMIREPALWLPDLIWLLHVSLLSRCNIFMSFATLLPSSRIHSIVLAQPWPDFKLHSVKPSLFVRVTPGLSSRLIEFFYNYPRYLIIGVCLLFWICLWIPALCSQALRSPIQLGCQSHFPELLWYGLSRGVYTS